MFKSHGCISVDPQYPSETLSQLWCSKPHYQSQLSPSLFADVNIVFPRNLVPRLMGPLRPRRRRFPKIALLECNHKTVVSIISYTRTGWGGGGLYVESGDIPIKRIIFVLCQMKTMAIPTDQVV